eukprot:6169420-Pyramimonas_sp.AAC.1
MENLAALDREIAASAESVATPVKQERKRGQVPESGWLTSAKKFKLGQASAVKAELDNGTVGVDPEVGSECKEDPGLDDAVSSASGLTDGSASRPKAPCPGCRRVFMTSTCFFGPNQT